jgi:hypothetical protein
MRYCLIDQPRSSRRKAGHDFRLAAICPADHAWVLALDGEFAIRNGVREGRSSREDFVGLVKFARDEQRVAQRPMSHRKYRWILVVIGQSDQILRQRDRPWNRMPHQAGIPSEPAGGEPAWRSGDEEVELLTRRWEQAKARHGCVVLISAEPGIGKSRLADAFRESLKCEPHARLRYFCSPNHQDSALFPFISQLERAAKIALTAPYVRKPARLTPPVCRSQAVVKAQRG